MSKDTVKWHFQRMKCKACPFAMSCKIRKQHRILNRPPLCVWEHDKEETENSRLFDTMRNKHIADLEERNKQLGKDLDKKIKELTKVVHSLKQDSAYLFLPFDISSEKHNPCGICEHYKTCSTKDCSSDMKGVLCRLYPDVLKEFETLVINWQPMTEKPLPYFPN